MFCSIKWAVALPGLALALLMGPAAFAAPEDEKPEAQQSQAPDDSKAYLPPWMQKSTDVTANAADKGTETAAPGAPGDPAAKQKAAGQRTPRRNRDGFFGQGFSFFWR
jgi:hypothetical protein